MRKPVTHPSTCDKIYTDEERDFIQAVQAYKDKYRVRFPNLSELFYVVRKLGYRKSAEREEI